MSCTPRELVAWLRGAGYAVDEPAGSVTVAGVPVPFSMHERAPRRLGALSLPVLHVTFRFDGINSGERDAFLARFDLYTRRGGG